MCKSSLVVVLCAGVAGCLEGKDRPVLCPSTCGTAESHTVCNVDGTCSCSVGFNDCNDNIDSFAGDGCECGGVCQGTECVKRTECAQACGASAICESSSGTCKDCANGTFDCDGDDTTCESTTACATGGDGGLACDPKTAYACNSSQWYCDGNTHTCQPCPGGIKAYNCDGLDDCEETMACQQCLAKCTEENEHNCVENTNFPGTCVQCESAIHCQINPRAWGPKCNTENNLCQCEGANDCQGRSTGSLCRVVGATKVCSCETSDDCKVAPYTVCSATNTCEKP